MDQVFRFSQMAQSFRHLSMRIKNWDKVDANGPMVVNMRVILKTMSSTGKVTIIGLKVKYIEGLGKMGRSMDKELISGQMENHIVVHMKMILSMVMVSLLGQVVQSMKETGIRESNTVKEHTRQNQGRFTLEVGNMVELVKKHWFKLNMGSGKPRGINAARKLKNRRRLQLWADKDYNKAHLGNEYKKPFAGASHAKGIVVEKFAVEAK